MGEDRSPSWLRGALADIWRTYFSDLHVVNRVEIVYWRPCKSRLGWIALSESGGSTLIGINRLLRLAVVPDDICLVTIAHEVVHYGHGFGSPLPRRYADPHADGVVERELEERGLGDMVRRYEAWVERWWADVYRSHCQRRVPELVPIIPNRGREDDLMRDVAALDVPMRARIS